MKAVSKTKRTRRKGKLKEPIVTYDIWYEREVKKLKKKTITLLEWLEKQKYK